MPKCLSGPGAKSPIKWKLGIQDSFSIFCSVQMILMLCALAQLPSESGIWTTASLKWNMEEEFHWMDKTYRSLCYKVCFCGLTLSSHWRSPTYLHVFWHAWTQFTQKVFSIPNSNLQPLLEALSFQLLSMQLTHLGSAPLKSGELNWSGFERYMVLKTTVGLCF